MRSLSRVIGLCGLLTSACLVGSFSIVDTLHGNGSAGASNQAGSEATASGGSSGGQGNTGGAPSSAGSAQGGMPAQGGASNVAGAPAAQAGDGGDGGASGAAGAAFAPEICAEDGMGIKPLLCDDFEGASVHPAWSFTPPLNRQMTFGRDGNLTRTLQLDGTSQIGTTLEPMHLETTGNESTLSFWFQMKHQEGEGLFLVYFYTPSNSQLILFVDNKGMHWKDLDTMVIAPTTPINGSIPYDQWFCASIYVSAGNATLRYFSAANPNAVQTLVIDDTPTPGVDEQWGQQQFNFKKFSHLNVFGPIANFYPGLVLLDDVLLTRGTSNVCGL